MRHGRLFLSHTVEDDRRWCRFGQIDDDTTPPDDNCEGRGDATTTFQTRLMWGSLAEGEGTSNREIGKWACLQRLAVFCSAANTG